MLLASLITDLGVRRASDQGLIGAGTMWMLEGPFDANTGGTADAAPSVPWTAQLSADARAAVDGSIVIARGLADTPRWRSFVDDWAALAPQAACRGDSCKGGLNYDVAG